MLFGYDKYVTTEAGTGLLGRYRSFALWAQLLLVLVCGGNLAKAQQFSPSGSQTSTNSEPPAADSVQPKNDRIFGVLPNYRTVENPNIRMGPLSTKGKFKLALEDSFDPYACVIAGAAAAISNVYYPKENRTLSNNLSPWGVMVGEDTFFNLLKEYWPDIRRKMFKR